MSCFTVQVLEPSGKIIEVETCAGEVVSFVTLENRSVPNIALSECVAQLPSDFEERIFAVVSGDIIASTGISSSISGNKLYLNSILNSSSGISLNHNDGIYTISATGLALTSHQHLSTDITNFNNSVSGLIPIINGGEYIISNFDNNTYTISASGLQPSGNYSLDGHTHTSVNITDFISSVSGLLPIKNIFGGSGINVSSSSGDYTVAVTGNFGLTSEEVDDRVYSLLVAGSNININYDDNNNQLTISTSGLQPSGNYSVTGHTHISNDITDFNSSVSGLLPPPTFSSLSGVSGVTVTQNNTNYVVSLTDPTIQLSDITDLSSDAKTFLLSSSSSNLRSLITDETGSGSLVFNFSPNFSGIPLVPTANSGTNTNQIASTQFVRTEISNLIDSSPSTLDTLNELANALGNDPNFATTITNSLSGKVNKSGDTMTGSLYAPSGLFDQYLTVNNVPVSISGHTHNASDINDFNNSVSGLLPVTNIIGDGNTTVHVSGSIYTISTSGNVSDEIEEYSDPSYLPASGSSNILYRTIDNSKIYQWVDSAYIEIGPSFSGILNTTIFTDNISNFNSSVSGLLPNINGSGYINSSFNNNVYTISVSGLQPSGSYSITGHTHASSDITDFNSSVSGLLPVKNIVGTGNTTVSSSSGIFTINSVGIVSNPSGISGSTAIINIVQISQANYDLLGAYDSNTLYIING